MGLVERKTLRWGGSNTKGNVIYCGVPGPAAAGGAITHAAGAAAIATYIQAAEDSYQRIDLGRRCHTSGPVRAISIAPDSAIHTCDIALAGRDGEIARHRISPGNPLIGTFEDDFALVSIPNSLPAAAKGSTVISHDSADAPLTAGTQISGWPLRLEVWRGDNVPIRSDKRAGYYAHFVFAQAAGDDATAQVCVDGRRRISVTVDVTDVSGAGTCTTTMFGLEPRKVAGSPGNTRDTVIPVPLPLDLIGTLSATTVQGAPDTFAFEGVPLTVLRIAIAQATESAIVQIHVKAYD